MLVAITLLSLASSSHPPPSFSLGGFNSHLSCHQLLSWCQSTNLFFLLSFQAAPNHSNFPESPPTPPSTSHSSLSSLFFPYSLFYITVWQSLRNWNRQRREHFRPLSSLTKERTKVLVPRTPLKVNELINNPWRKSNVSYSSWISSSVHIITSRI